MLMHCYIQDVLMLETTLLNKASKEYILLFLKFSVLKLSVVDACQKLVLCVLICSAKELASLSHAQYSLLAASCGTS